MSLSDGLTLRQESVLYPWGVMALYGLPMDRALIISYLQAAEDQVEIGQRYIADQCDLISTLERTGHHATSAIARLRVMEQTQTQHIADRDRLRADLATLNAPQAKEVAADDSK